MQGSPTGVNIFTLYNGPAVSPDGLFDGLTNNGTIVAADLKGPLAGKVWRASFMQSAVITLSSSNCVLRT